MRRLILILSIVCAGCASTNHSGSPDLKGAPDSTVRSQLLTDQILDEAKTNGYATIVEKATLLVTELKHTRDVIQWYVGEWGKQHDEITVKDVTLKQMDRAYIGPAAWRAWYWILGGWIALGVGSMLLGGFFATGPLAFISGFILRFIPFANLFVRGRDVIRTQTGMSTITRNALGNVIAATETVPFLPRP